jgi:peptide/nickel transport system substrate-binding protein
MPCISPEDVDMASIYVAYWKDIGVNVTLQPLEEGSHTSVKYGKTYEHIIYSGRGVWTPYQFASFVPGHNYNQSAVDDPYVNERHPQLWAYENIGKQNVKNEILKDMTEHVLAQAYRILVPLPYAYTIWWPWLKNYYGVQAIGIYNHEVYSHYVWIDQELKQSMGY